MYLYIFEEGSSTVYESIKPEDYQACNDGYFQIFDISDQNNVMEYYNDEWRKLAIKK